MQINSTDVQLRICALYLCRTDRATVREVYIYNARQETG